MVKAIVEIDKEANKILNHLKVEYNLKTKSEAINFMAQQLKQFIRTEPEIRPEYLEKLKRIEKGKFIKVGSIKDFRKRYGLK
jgi:hypothetical protein